LHDKAHVRRLSCGFILGCLEKCQLAAWIQGRSNAREDETVAAQMLVRGAQNPQPDDG
jgi:hypothetical protein